MTYYIKMDLDGDVFGPNVIGPYETREDAEQDARPYIGREGWTVEIIEKDEEFYRDFV